MSEITRFINPPVPTGTGRLNSNWKRTLTLPDIPRAARAQLCDRMAGSEESRWHRMPLARSPAQCRVPHGRWRGNRSNSTGVAWMDESQDDRTLLPRPGGGEAEGRQCVRCGGFQNRLPTESTTVNGERKSNCHVSLLESWWAVRDSNPRLPACKAGALTN